MVEKRWSPPFFSSPSTRRCLLKKTQIEEEGNYCETFYILASSVFEVMVRSNFEKMQTNRLNSLAIEVMSTSI